MRSFLTAAAVIACVVGVAPVTIHVAHAADPKLEAKRLIGEGDAQFKKGDYEGALASYQKAYEAFQSPKIFFPMAQAEEKLGRDLEALTHYEQLLADSGDALPQSVRSEAQARIEEIEKRIAVVTFDVDPPGATVSVDDVELGAAPLEKATRLMPGKHKVTVAAEEHKTKDVPLDLKAGDRPVVSVKLESSRPKVALHPGGGDRPAQPIDANEGTGRGVLYTSMFLAGGATIGATITGILAIQKHAIFVDPMKTPAQRAAAQSSGRNLAFDTDLMIFGAVAAGTFAVIWYYSAVKPRAEHRRARSPVQHGPDPTGPVAPPPPGGDDDEAPLGMIVAPWASADAGGLAVFGRF